MMNSRYSRTLQVLCDAIHSAISLGPSNKDNKDEKTTALNQLRFPSTRRQIQQYLETLEKRILNAQPLNVDLLIETLDKSKINDEVLVLSPRQCALMNVFHFFMMSILIECFQTGNAKYYAMVAFADHVKRNLNRRVEMVELCGTTIDGSTDTLNIVLIGRSADTDIQTWTSWRDVAVLDLWSGNKHPLHYEGVRHTTAEDFKHYFTKITRIKSRYALQEPLTTAEWSAMGTLLAATWKGLFNREKYSAFLNKDFCRTHSITNAVKNQHLEWFLKRFETVFMREACRCFTYGGDLKAVDAKSNDTPLAAERGENKASEVVLERKVDPALVEYVVITGSRSADQSHEVGLSSRLGMHSQTLQDLDWNKVGSRLNEVFGKEFVKKEQFQWVPEEKAQYAVLTKPLPKKYEPFFSKCASKAGVEMALLLNSEQTHYQCKIKVASLFPEVSQNLQHRKTEAILSPG